MAIFHLTTKVISRGKGQSAIAAAAYRSGEKLHDEKTNEPKSYRAGADRILFTDIMAPKDAPEWAHDRNALWNQAERIETRKDARLAREIEIALPHELTDQQREWLVKDFVREAFVRRGYAVDIAIHAPYETSDERNHHVHLLIPERRIGPDGFAAKKDPTMNRREQLNEWREQWANLANRHLERHGHEARIDHRSLEAQGIDREPTSHLGYAAIEIAERGGQSDRFDAFKAVLARNDIRVEMQQIDRELAELARAAEAQAEAERARQKQATPETGLDWTDRAGMVAQQDSAMKAFKTLHEKHQAAPPPARTRAEEKPPGPGGPDATKPQRLEFYEDRNPTKDHDRDR